MLQEILKKIKLHLYRNLSFEILKKNLTLAARHCSEIQIAIAQRVNT